MSKRIDWIDVAKGFLIILVVLGHSHVNTVVNMAINSFHMVAFFVLSGMTFRNTDSFGNFLMKKAKSFIMPYLVFSGILLLYQYAKTIVFGGYSFDLISGLVSIVIPISGRTSTTVYGLWFFPCLFLAEIVFYWLMKMKERAVVVSIGIYLIFTGCCAVIYCYSGVASIISVLPIAVASLAFGKWGYNRIEVIKERKLTFLILSGIAFLLSVIGNYSICGHTVDLSSMTLGFMPLYFVSSIAGTIFVCIMSMCLHNLQFIRRLGKDSLYYYGLHYEVIGIAEKIVSWGWGQTLGTFMVLIPVVIFYKKIKEALMKKNG